MTLSAIDPPSVAMRAASQGGTRPPCSGKSAIPDRFMQSLSHLRYLIDDLTDNGNHQIRLLLCDVVAAAVGDDKTSPRDRIQPPGVLQRLGLDRASAVRSKRANRFSGEWHLRRGDGVDQDEGDADRNVTCPG